MNGVHDMGGMEGLGALIYERDEPVFHASWEGRVLALVLAASAWRKWNIDAGRHARELIPGPDYLRMSYYEKWLDGLIRIMVETGMVTAAEIESGKPAPGTPKTQPVLAADKVQAALATRHSFIREVNEEPRFTLGQSVRARNLHPSGHTRLPGYARGRTGRVEHLHGAQVLPDSNAHFRGERPQHLYGVRFAARELWGERGHGLDSVTLCLWEDYLEPA